MTDTKKDVHAELMWLAEKWLAYARMNPANNEHGLKLRAALDDYARTLTDRIAELESRLEIDPAHSYDGIDTRDATIKELEAQLEAVVAGGVGAAMSKHAEQMPPGHWVPFKLSDAPDGVEEIYPDDETYQFLAPRGDGSTAGNEAWIFTIPPLPTRAQPAPAVVRPDWYHAECDDPDRSGFYLEKSDAQTQVNDYGGSVTGLFAQLQQIAEPAAKDEEIADYKQCAADIERLSRDCAVAIDGADKAARQPSLSDISSILSGYARSLGMPVHEAIVEIDGLRNDALRSAIVAFGFMANMCPEELPDDSEELARWIEANAFQLIPDDMKPEDLFIKIIRAAIAKEMAK